MKRGTDCFCLRNGIVVVAQGFQLELAFKAMRFDRLWLPKRLWTLGNVLGPILWNHAPDDLKENT